MSATFKNYFLLTIVSLLGFCANAQESIYPEINNVFLEKLIDAAKTNYPLMKSYKIRLIMAEDNIKKTNKTWYDLLSFSASYSPTNSISISNYVLSGYQFGFSINFASLLQKPYAIKDAKNQLILSQLEKEGYDINIESEVKTRYIKYLQSVLFLKLQSKNSIDMEASFRQTKYKFEKAEETFDTYNKALISITQQKQNIITAEGNLILAKYSLEEMICKKLEDIH